MPASYPSRASSPATLRGWLGMVAWLLPSFAWGQLVEVQQVSEPAGFVSETKVVEVGSSFTTLLPELSSNGYIFGYWTAGSIRLADGNGRSVVQAEVSIAEGITLTAHYFPEAEDTDNDGVRDWFEWRNFGDLSQSLSDDVDGDGFTNGQEDALGQEPTIFDEVEDGGIPARRSDTFVYADTSMVPYLIKSEPLGFVEEFSGYVEQNATIVSPNLHGESNGYTFAYWSVNGQRQGSRKKPNVDAETLNVYSQSVPYSFGQLILSEDGNNILQANIMMLGEFISFADYPEGVVVWQGGKWYEFDADTAITLSTNWTQKSWAEGSIVRHNGNFFYRAFGTGPSGASDSYPGSATGIPWTNLGSSLSAIEAADDQITGVSLNGTTTTTAVENSAVDGSGGYFKKYEPTWGFSVSQVTVIIDKPKNIVAHYLPTGEDSDGDGVADWFELNQFGDLNNGPEDDPDGDQFSNAQEEALGQEATVRDEVEDGGITARRSPSFTYRDTSMVAYIVKSEPAGFVEETTGYVEQNASVTTPNLHGESNGYTFAYWSVNGVRQVSPNGLSLSQVAVEINATATLIAHYLVTTEDSDGDGVEDWFEIYQFGNLDQSPEGDFDGDGFSNKKENELGQEALVRDEVEDGGITARRSKSVLYFQQQNYAPSDLELNSTIIFTYQDAGSVVGEFIPTDLNDPNLQDTYTYSLLTGPGGEDYALYSISESRLQTASEFTSEANHSLLIRVADSGGEYFDKNFTIHVLDPALDPDGDGLTNQQEWLAGTRHDHPDSDGDGFSDGVEITAGTNPLDAEDFPNSAPTDLNSTDLLIVAENQPAETLVGEFNATDPDGDVIVYSLVSGQGDAENDFFLLDENGTLTTASALDYEAGDTRTIRVQASDPHGASIQGVFTVHVTNDEADDVEATFAVSGGQHQAPFFTFTDQNGDTPDFSTLRLKKGKTYEFVASGISSGHTFMIGESYGDTSSSLVTGNTLNSYQNGAKLTLSIPDDFSGKLYYFCTYHDTMIQELLVGRPQHIIDLNSTVSLEMIWVEPGTFMMGQVGIANARSEPVHNVTLTKGFYLGKYEVTQLQYEAVMTSNTGGFSANPSEYEGNPNRPVENTSWEDVQVFLSRLNEQHADKLAGWAFVLPTEAQWEYACRAGTTTAYSWGEGISPSNANYGNNIGQTTNVGQYMPNSWGFYDMHGNVWEWTADLREPYTHDDQIDPQGPSSGSYRASRGGAWFLGSESLLSAERPNYSKNLRSSRIGFRLALKQITEPPINLNSVAELTVSENQPIGTIVGEFNATDPDGESRYEIISGVQMSWQEAREDALSRGGHLVTITSQAENNVVTNLLESAGYPDDGPYWIGMHEVGQGGSSAGQFQWVTGEAIDYTNWQASHPEYNGNTRAVYVTTINTNNLGKWYDWRDDPNSKCNGYILELPPAVSYHLVAGEGDGNNSLFTLDQNGTLKTAVVLDYETGDSLTIRVQARDELNSTVEGNFTVSVLPIKNWFHSITGFSGMHRMNLAVSDHKSFGVVGGKNPGGFAKVASYPEFELSLDFEVSTSTQTWVQGVSFDKEENVYIGGHLGAPDNFGGINVPFRYERDPWVAKINKQGDWQWVRSVGTNAWSGLDAIATDEAGNSYVTGYIYGSATFGSQTVGGAGLYDAFLAKIDTDGNWVWAKSIGGSSGDFGRTVALDGKGGVYWAGDFVGSVNVDGNYLVSNGGGDLNGGGEIFVAKLDTAGNYIWAVSGGSSDSDQPYDIVADDAGNAYIAARVRGNPSFGNQSVEHQGGNDGVVAKISSTGDWVWARSLGGVGGDSATGVSLGDDNQVLVAGSIQGLGYFNGEIQVGLDSANTAYVLELDKNGEYLRHESFEGISIQNIDTNEAGDTLISGTHSGETNYFGTSHQSGDSTDVFVALFDYRSPKPIDLTTGLVAWYPFDGNASDMSGNGNDAILKGSNPTFVSTSSRGLALVLGEASWAQVPHTEAINPLGSRTISFLYSSEHGGRVFSNRREVPSGRNWDLGLGESIFRLQLHKGYTSWLYIDIPRIKGSFQHIVFVLNSDSGELLGFVDGNLIEDAPITFTNLEENSLSGWVNNFAAVPLDIGREDGYNNTIAEGIIDEIRFYNRALTELEVQALYELEKPEEKNYRIVDLNSTAPLIIHENQPIGTVVGEFNATDPDGDSSLISYSLISGEGDGNNSLFTLDQDGVLKTAAILSFEEDVTLSIRVQAKDSGGLGISQSFLVSVKKIDSTIPPRPNTFFIQSIQAGSTTDVDNLTITDLQSGKVVYNNQFSQANDATNDLLLHYYPDTGGLEGGTSSDWNDFQENSSKNRVVNGKLRLETTGFNQNGRGGYNSRSHATYTGVLPEDFLIEFDAQRMQWAGHSYFWVFYKDPADNPAHYADGGMFSASRESNLKQLLIRFASAGSVFYDCGISYSGKGWIERFEPTGSLQTPHRLGISLDGTVVSFFMNGNLMSSKDIGEFIYDRNLIQNQRPANLSANRPLIVLENQDAGSFVVNFSASDPDGDKLNFFLTEGDGDDDNHLFELSKLGALTTRGSFNFEEKEIREIRVAVSDGRGGEVSKSFEVRIVDQNDFPSGLKALDQLEVMENQQSGTIVGQFSVTDEDGDFLSFDLVRGPGDSGNSNFSLSPDGILSTAKEFDFEESANQSIRVSASDGNGGTVSESFVVKIIDQFENRAPQELNSTGVLSVAENSKIGTLVARFKAVDPEGDDLTFSLVSGEGDSDNGLFVIDENGTLTTGAVFDFEEAATRSIRVGVADPHGESISQKFTVRIIDHQNEAIILEVAEFQSDGEAGEIGRLKVLGREDLSFGLGQDEIGAMHLFVIEDDGTLFLAEDAIHSASYNLTALIFENGEPLDKQPVTVHVTVAEPEDFMDADTSDPTYHETALMIRDLAVVQRNQRNGHNPITKIENLENGLFVTTAQPHGRKFGDSVVLSGVEGLRIENVKNWNFMIDEVNNNSFRLRKFGKNEHGHYDGSLGEVVSPEAGTQYQPSGSDFLLGQWTFGHLLGNMVSEQDDPVDFYRHFANQWKNEQVVNGWSTDIRRQTHRALVPNPNQVGKLTLANLPFRLLAIGNRIDLFHAGSIRKVGDAGEGRFVFTMTQPFELPDEELTIWKINEKTFDRGNFTLIFEYGQPAGDFATLAKWAKDWHQLERNDFNESLFEFDEEYFNTLNDLTDRFSKRGAHPEKPNGNPINQVRTNDFIQGIWQMREFNLANKEKAHDVRALPERETKLKVDESLDSIDIGLWTTTTKNNPMVDSNSQQVHRNVEESLARWINQRESHILSAEVGPRAPEWMEGPIANEPFGFTYTFKSENIRTNLARYKFSLSTCTGCHTGDTDTGFQMVVSSGHDQRAFFADFMVGNKRRGMRNVRDHVNFEEKHAFFDLKAREEIARDILAVSQQVDVARLRLTRTEIKLNGFEAPAHAFVSGGIIGDWQYDLPSGREDNDFYILNSSTGELSIRGNGQTPPFGKGRIFIRARATDGTGMVIERAYSLWILSAEESRLSQDLDSSAKAGNPPPLSTPRPNRTH